MKRIRAYMVGILSRQAQEPDQWKPPQSLEWMPSGTNEIRVAGPEGEPATYEVSTLPEDAETLDKQLQKALALASEGKASRPFIDFNHDGEQAAAIPKRFFWDDGIRLEVEWTGSGISALANRDFSYFSPEFYLSDDGHPTGIPEVGPIGGLVNTPAFQSIERLAAKKSPEAPASDTKGKQMESLLAKLAAAGVVPKDQPMTEDALVECLSGMNKQRTEATATAEAATATCASLTKERDALKAKVDATVKASAERDVAAAIAAGKIDESTKAEWVEDYIANPERISARLAGIKTAAPVKASGHPNDNLPVKPTGGGELTGINRVAAAFAAKRGTN